ncbi:uncharacterized protein LOC113512987 isoform X2 [Galleria mellonella]|uniref:Uncharacterized protein LOC113512987 isoform X2 n=1 Tax=Galleria mellonella TaxID=7137 RepID=A0ABM3MDW2_GALME|nr:uncharacterized protein LOC113512987 isoform X2 [Galleria mellonella]
MATELLSPRVSNCVISNLQEMESSAENMAIDIAADSAAALHERLVAYVHAVAGGSESRSEVWVEHSYARARDGRAAGAARELLAPRPPPACDTVDVERLDPPPPEPIEPEPPAPASDDDDDGDWEARVAALAPTAAHERLAAAVAAGLRRLRLARLAGCAAPALRAEARRLRLALAPLWAAAGPVQQRPAAWLHAALLAYLPRGPRRDYDELVARLRRAVPRLAGRLLGTRAPPPAPDPLAAVGPPVSSEAGPLLVWLGGGRWARRLRALLPTRELAAPAAGGCPQRWCAATAAALRASLLDAVAEAGERPVVVGGAGAGAALVAALAGSARVRGALLLAPPLLTADGGDDTLRELRVPALLVVGSGAAQSWRGAAREAAAAAAAAAARRVLLVAAADDALRLPAAHCRRLRLPQHALDAAIADECARWVNEIAEEDATQQDKSGLHIGVEAASPERPEKAERERTAGGNRSIEIVEGRVVTRVAGGTPLALLPPRRPAGVAAAGAGTLPLAAADIMQLPIVFADDERVAAAAAAAAAAEAEAAEAGGVRARFTRVVLAKRGRRARQLLLQRPH